MIRAGIIGVSGYTGCEILSILLGHPKCEVTWLTAKKITSPTPVSDLFGQFKGLTNLVVENEINADKIAKACDVVFLALPHKISMSYAGQFLKKGIKVVDLSSDYRLPDLKRFQSLTGMAHLDADNLGKAVYGLAEWNADKIAKAELIANPGCYPTSILLAILPLLADGIIDLQQPILADSKSGVSGAGRNPTQALHFSEVNESIKAYKVLEHQHTPEIVHTAQAFTQASIQLKFVPHLIPIHRGLLSTIYAFTDKKTSYDALLASYRKHYREAPFVRLCARRTWPEVRHVAHTNFCDIGFTIEDNVIVIVSAIDNLVKGAAGQAVQNMNLLYNIDQKEALVP